MDVIRQCTNAYNYQVILRDDEIINDQPTEFWIDLAEKRQNCIDSYLISQGKEVTNMKIDVLTKTNDCLEEHKNSLEKLSRENPGFDDKSISYVKKEADRLKVIRDKCIKGIEVQ